LEVVVLGSRFLVRGSFFVKVIGKTVTFFKAEKVVHEKPPFSNAEAKSSFFTPKNKGPGYRASASRAQTL
jgi:hypothetical protein